MKRFVIALIILSLIAGLCIYGLYVLYQTREELISDIELLEELLNDGNNEVLAYRSEKFNQKWHNREQFLIRFFRHTQLDEITSVSARLPGLAKYDDLAEYSAELNRVRTFVNHIWEEEVPLFRNVF